MKWLTTSRNILNTEKRNTIRTMVSTVTATNTGAQSDQQLDSDSDCMQSSQAESEEPSEPKVKGTDEDVLLETSSTGSISVGANASSEEGYSADCYDQQLESGSDDDSDGMQSCQADSEEVSGPKVTCSTDESALLESSSTNGSVNIGKTASSGDGYRIDSSAFSDQASDQSFYYAASGQKQKSIMRVTWNLLDLKYYSTEMDSSSQQDGSYLGEKATPASKAKASRNTAKRNLSSCLKAKKNHKAAISTSTAVAPGLSSSNKQNRRHHCSNHHRRRSRPSPHVRDRAHVSSTDLNALLSNK
jgi:hypothetical protein